VRWPPPKQRLPTHCLTDLDEGPPRACLISITGGRDLTLSRSTRSGDPHPRGSRARDANIILAPPSTRNSKASFGVRWLPPASTSRRLRSPPRPVSDPHRHRRSRSAARRFAAAESRPAPTQQAAYEPRAVDRSAEAIQLAEACRCHGGRLVRLLSPMRTIFRPAEQDLPGAARTARCRSQWSSR